MREHDYIKPSDPHHCSEREDVPHFCYACELANCKVCGGAEGELPVECPGVRMPQWIRGEILGGRANFKNGRWFLPEGDARD